MKFKVGIEVEHTPYFGEHTLFVREQALLNRIIHAANIAVCKHVYLGADLSINASDEVEEWLATGIALIAHGFHVTIDLPIGLAKSILARPKGIHFIFRIAAPGLWQHRHAATIRLDDATAPGVQCISAEDTRWFDGFTQWSDYRNDRELDL